MLIDPNQIQTGITLLLCIAGMPGCPRAISVNVVPVVLSQKWKALSWQLFDLIQNRLTPRYTRAEFHNWTKRKANDWKDPCSYFYLYNLPFTELLSPVPANSTGFDCVFCQICFLRHINKSISQMIQLTVMQITYRCREPSPQCGSFGLYNIFNKSLSFLQYHKDSLFSSSPPAQLLLFIETECIWFFFFTPPERSHS